MQQKLHVKLMQSKEEKELSYIIQINTVMEPQGQYQGNLFMGPDDDEDEEEASVIPASKTKR